MTPEGLTMSADVETPANPFPGLRPFEFGESHLYFGRDGQSDQLIRKLSATRFVAVVGTSGSGKSSLVRAGLLPDLFSGFMASAGSHWRVCLMRPGNDPLGNLARALNATSVFGSEIEENAQIQTAITEATLRRGSLGLVEAVRQNRMPSNESLLVVVDQFEELFRFARVSGSEQYRYEAATFVKLLLEAARQRAEAIYVVLTMRSDFLGDCSMFWDLPEAINEGQYLIPRMTRDQRAEAITGPVAVCGGEITQRLVNRLLNDTGDNPDLLPILQHALMRTWEKWAEDHAEGEAVDLRHYEAIGTMSDALSRHADEAWGELPDERSRQIAEKVFKALTEKGEDNREVRRPTELGQLCALTGATTPEVVSVLDVFRREGRSFLMPPASVRLDENSLIDISHESLIRNWQRLKEWVNEEALSAHIYRRVAETAELYGRGEAGLWHDPDLQIALNWREKRRPNQVWAARYHAGFETAMKFLDTSVAARDAALLEAERRRRKELRRARLTAIIFALAFIFSMAVLTYARIQKIRAEEALMDAEVARNEAVRQKELADSQARRAEEQSDRATEERNNAEQQRKVAEERKLEAEERKVEAERATAEAELQARAAKENQARAELAKKEADKERRVAEEQRNIAVTAGEKNRQLLYAADLNLAQQSFEDNNIERGRELLEAHAPQREPFDDSLATPKDDPASFEWRYLNRLFHREAATLSDHQQPVMSVAFSPDGILASGSTDGTVRLWERNSNQAPKTVKVMERDGVRAVAFSPNGEVLAVAGGSGQVKLLSTASPEQPGITLKLPENLSNAPINSLSNIAFSPDGKTLALGIGTTGKSHNVLLWDTETHQLRANLEKQSSFINSILFFPDSKTFLTGSSDGTLIFWDAISYKSIVTMPNEKIAPFSGDNPVRVLAVSGNESEAVLAIGYGDGTVRLMFRAAGDEEPHAIELTQRKSGVVSLSFTPDGKILAVGRDDGSVQLFASPAKIARYRELTTLKGHLSSITSLSFSSDGKVLATGSLDKTVKLWEINPRILDGMSAVSGLALSRDGQTLAVRSIDNTVNICPVENLQMCTSWSRPALAITSMTLSPDGRTLALSSPDRSVRLWDIGSSNTEPVRLDGHEDIVNTMAFSPDGKMLATGSRDRSIRLWEIGSQRQPKIYQLPDNAESVYAVAFSHDGQMLAAGSGDGSVNLWNINSAEGPITLSGFARGVISVAFSHDGQMLAAGGKNATVKLWNIAALETASARPWNLAARKVDELATLAEHTGGINSLAFSPDDKTLATGSDDGTIKLWSAKTYKVKVLITLKGHTNAVTGLVFAPDGTWLATGSYDNTVRFWDAATGEERPAQRR